MLGSRIKEVRKVVGLESSVVSNYLGVDLKIYMMIENDANYLNYEIVSKLCTLFGCEEKMLLSEEEIVCTSLKNVNIDKINDIVHFRKVCSQYL